MIFRTTHNIFVDNGEFFDINWMDKDTVTLPPNPLWDYSRELKIEDVDLWEVIFEGAGGWALYASWCPYAEFFMLKTGSNFNAANPGWGVETYYGPGAQNKIIERANELNIPILTQKKWVEKEDMWLYEEPKNTIDLDKTYYLL
jgi:hypothetical protein